MLYLFIDKKKDCNLIKIGITKDLEQREKSYHTANPLIEKIGYLRLDNPQAEKDFHFEMQLSLGFERVSGTEWYKISDPIAEFIEYYGFNAFQTTSAYNRVSYVYGTDARHPIPKTNLKELLKS